MFQLTNLANLFLLLVWVLFILISFVLFFSFIKKKIREKKNRNLDSASQSFLNNKPCQIHSWTKSEIGPNGIVLRCKNCNLIAGQDS